MRKYSYLLVIITMLFAACNTELPLPDAAVNHKITLLGELTANDTITIRAGQSISLTSTGNEPKLIKNLSVVVKDNNGLNTTLEEREDYLAYTLFTVPFTSSAAIIAAGGNYNISARHPQLGEATASVRIPKPFTAALTSTAFVKYNNDSVLRFNIDLANPDGANTQYVIEAVRRKISINGYFYFGGNKYSMRDNRLLYDSLKGAGVPTSDHYDTVYTGVYSRLQGYTTDELNDNGSSITGGRLVRRVFLQGKTIGGLHHTEFLIPRGDIYGSDGPYAEIVINVKSVAADYYNFLKAYEVYDPSAGTGNTNPAPLPGNVQGGFGMVGGVYRQSFKVIY